VKGGLKILLGQTLAFFKPFLLFCCCNPITRLLHASENTEEGSNKTTGNQEKETFLHITKPLVTMNEHPMRTQNSASQARPEQGRKNRYQTPSPGICLQLKGETWLDTDAVIAQLGISRKSLERYRKHRGLVCSHIGNRYFFSETELLRFFKQHEEPKGKR